MDTQNERVLRYLHDHGSIHQGVTLAWSPPITRLAARIADLRASGNPVDAIGKAGKFALYGFTADGTVDPRRPDAAPLPPRATCPKCAQLLDDVKPTLSPDVVRGKCLHHGYQVVVR